MCGYPYFYLNKMLESKNSQTRFDTGDPLCHRYIYVTKKVRKVYILRKFVLHHFNTTVLYDIKITKFYYSFQPNRTFK